MAFNETELKDAVETALIMAGKDSVLVKAHSDALIGIGKKEFWRAHNWTFARKYTTITLTASNSTGIVFPEDAESIIGLTRLSTDDDGFKITPLTETAFDEIFPNLAEVDADRSYFAKMVSNESDKRIFFGPPSSDQVTVGCVYKMEYSDDRFKGCVPDDYVGYVRDCVFYGGFITDAQGRKLIDFGEWKARMMEAKKKDRVHQATVSTVMQQQPRLISRSSWRFALGGEEYHGMS